ncbi:MAG: hypothetical protein ACRCYE_10335 [Sarcina sp.]
MNYIRSVSEKVKKIIVNSCDEKVTDFNMRVDELEISKNIKITFDTEFNQQFRVVLYSLEKESTPFITFDTSKYSTKDIVDINIGLSPLEEKKLEEILMLRNTLPNLILGLLK